MIIEPTPLWPNRIARRKLPNGAVILAVRDESSPSTYLRVLFPYAGGIADGRSGPGTARFVATMLTNGTAASSSEELAEKLDVLGASIQISAAREAAALDGRCLAEDFERLLAIAQEMLQAPSFSQNEMELVRREILADIRAQRKNTRAVAVWELSRLVYPPPHPFSLPVEGVEEYVAGACREDLVGFWHRCYGPNEAIFVAVGDIDANYAVDAITLRFEGWEATVESSAGPSDPAPITQIRREMVSIEGKTQADVALGIPGPSRADPYYLPLMLSDLILGQPVFGRIWRTLREKMGLAYHAFTVLPAGRWGGLWYALCGVPPEKTAVAVNAIYNEFTQMRAQGPTAEELENAVSSRLGRIQIESSGHSGKARLLAQTEFHNLGFDYWERLPDLLRCVTRDMVIDAFQRRFLGAYAVAAAGPGGMVLLD